VLDNRSERSILVGQTKENPVKIQMIIRKILRIFIMYPLLLIGAPIILPLFWVTMFIMAESDCPVSEANEAVMWYVRGMQSDW